ncbi:hypothetical protein LB565_20160 [Mesorhizobium sp. CA14]|uniref:hypothetical protein n=1 Tax=Mesorhizobium sp. CA14 TaxID=2876642 RepID=UPI001CCF77F7|nr:hypothetical protein [Mesorhizobium sp. CA14]MBZ9850298.1 hypothetical protein [Mesorhizobium sp. CA14]
MAELSRRIKQAFVGLSLFGACFSLGTMPVRAAQVAGDKGTVYAEMVAVEQMCSFLGSPALLSLADLKALDPGAYDLSFREFSSSMDMWLTAKNKSVGADHPDTIFASDQTQSDITTRFNLCFGLHSADKNLINVLKVVFDEGMPPPDLWFKQINLGRAVDISTVVFIAAMQDGNEYLKRYLEGTAGLLASRVATARQNRAAQQSAASNEEGESDEDPGDDLDSVLGGGPAYAQYTCEITESALYGVPDFNGPGKSVTAEISVKGDGNAIINGKGIKAAKVFPASAGSDEPFNSVVYRAIDVKNALFSTEGLGPGLINPSQDELQAFEQMKGIMQGMSDSLFGGRTRILGISLANDTVVFGDLKPGANFVNRSTPNCTRTR